MQKRKHRAITERPVSGVYAADGRLNATVSLAGGIADTLVAAFKRAGLIDERGGLTEAGKAQLSNTKDAE